MLKKKKSSFLSCALSLLKQNKTFPLLDWIHKAKCMGYSKGRRGRVLIDPRELVQKNKTNMMINKLLIQKNNKEPYLF